MTKNIPVCVSIFRMCGGDDKKEICIEIEDKSSHTKFISVKMSMSDFAECVTGLSNCAGVGNVRGLDRIGKIMEHKEIIFPIPNVEFNKKKIIALECAKNYLEENESGEGWIPDAGFNSQNSFFKQGDQQFARTFVRRWGWAEIREEK